MADFIEIVENGGGGMSTAISQEEGSAFAVYRLKGADDNTPPTVAEVSQFFDTMLGGVMNLEPKRVNTGTAGAGKIIRVIPPVHPFRPELSVAAIKNMVGVGKQTDGSSVNIFGLPPITNKFPHYTVYDYQVQFTKRPYFLLPDEKIGLKSGTYFPPDGSSGKSFLYAEEWLRFTTLTRTPSTDFANATLGQLTFRTDSGTDPDTRQYGNTVYVSLQNSRIEMLWYQVPYRYFQDFGSSNKSYLTRFVGTVNQYEWNGFPAGSLMYLGATPTSYIPASPKRNAVLWGALATGLDRNLLCNVRLQFLHTARQGTDVPSAGHPLLSNKSFVAAGHNLQPNFKDRKFYYAVGDGASEAVKRPTYDSFPFQLFFTDPHLEQPGGGI